MQIRSLSRDCSTISRRIPLSPLATVSPCPYQEIIRWRWAALACWLKHAQQRANFEIATDCFADKGRDCGQFRLNPQARGPCPWLVYAPEDARYSLPRGPFCREVGVGPTVRRGLIFSIEPAYAGLRTGTSTREPREAPLQ